MALLYRRTAGSPLVNGGTTVLPFANTGLSTVGYGGARTTPQSVLDYYGSGGTSQYVASFTEGGKKVIQPQGTSVPYLVGTSDGKATFSPYVDFKKQWDLMRGTTSSVRYSTDAAGSTSRSSGVGTLNAVSPTPWSGQRVVDYATQKGEFDPWRALYSKVNSINAAFGDGREADSPFLNTRYNMLGQREVIGRSDPRHTSSAYEQRWPDLYNQYTSGTINGNQLFTRAMTDAVRNDRDEIGNSLFNFSAAPRVSFSFNSRGGGTIRGTGISFR